jgi:peptidoglycan hydrolase CwlO-like protein
VFDYFGPVINLIDKMNDDILMILVGFLLIVSTLFMWLWFSNRRKYHNLKHAIPANVVKSYLDSIIQNSTALKSQLFRGGGQDLGNVASVIPLHEMIGGEGVAISGAPSTALLEELNQKKAIISNLEAQLLPLKNSNRELDSKITSSQSTLTSAEAKIKELESLLAKSRTGGGDAVLSSELNMVSKERDDLKERLKEFEIIADDLANLKRLQQENEQLKRSLAGKGQIANSADQEIDLDEPVANLKNDDQPEENDPFENLDQSGSAPEDNSAFDEFLSASAGVQSEEPVQLPTETEPVKAAEPAVAPAPEVKGKSDKTPEDLLSEFEKMLG